MPEKLKRMTQGTSRGIPKKNARNVWIKIITNYQNFKKKNLREFSNKLPKESTKELPKQFPNELLIKLQNKCRWNFNKIAEKFSSVFYVFGYFYEIFFGNWFERKNCLMNFRMSCITKGIPRKASRTQRKET